MIEVRHARFPEDRDHVVAIFREYIGKATVSLDFQDYETELAGLPGKYAAPHGCVLLAWHDDDVIGCAGYRKVDDATCEMKRVYVRSSTRGQNVGRRLVEQVMREARAAGYQRMCLDVLPEFVAAQRLYKTLGFQPAPPVTFNPVPGTKFLGIDL